MEIISLLNDPSKVHTTAYHAGLRNHIHVFLLILKPKFVKQIADATLSVAAILVLWQVGYQ